MYSLYKKNPKILEEFLHIDIEQYRSFIKFEIDVEGDQITIRPTNLFTGLLLLGIITEPDRLGDKYESKIENYGIDHSYHPEGILMI